MNKKCPYSSLQTENERHLRIGYKYYNIYRYSKHLRIGEIKMRQEKNEVLLTIKDLNKLGAELTEIMQQLDMVNIAIQGLEFVERKDDLTFQWIARQFFTTNYTLNENISKKLDEIACYLLNADNEKELKVLKND